VEAGTRLASTSWDDVGAGVKIMPDKLPPLVSVLIQTFNRMGYLKATLVYALRLHRSQA
jgi:hypothetical protein